MLLAGGCANDEIAPGGGLVFNASKNQAYAFWGTGSAIQSLLSIVYYISEINRWNRLTLFHLLIISL